MPAEPHRPSAYCGILSEKYVHDYCILCFFTHYRFTFPSGFVRYQTAAVMVYGVVVLIGRIDYAALYCSSRSLLTSFENPGTFCTFTGMLCIANSLYNYA